MTGSSADSLGTGGGASFAPRILALAAAPVPYQVPLYRLLAQDKRIELSVLYCSIDGTRFFDAGFGGPVDWGIDLLSGYRSSFVQSAERNRVANGFAALMDRDIVPIVRSGAYDVIWVHGYSYASHWLAMLAASSRHIPVLVREEQTLLHARSKLKEAIRAPILRQIFAHTYGLSIGTNNYDFFLHYGMAPERLFFTPYSVDNMALQREAEMLAPSRGRLRADFGLAPGPKPVVLFSGRLVSKKQPLNLLRAFARVRSSYDCALLVVGDGPLRGEMEKLIADEHIPDVILAGFLDQRLLGKAYASSDIFVLPSGSHETWGIVVNEAMNFALPIVVSDKVGSAVDLVRNDENGFVVAADDVNELARSIAQLVESPALRLRMGEQSLRRITAWHYGTTAEGVVQATLAATGSRLADPTAGRWKSSRSGVRT